MTPIAAAYTDRVRLFQDWLLEASHALPDIGTLFEAVCARLDLLGFGFDRVTFNLELLHPELSGHGHAWVRGVGLTVFSAARGIERTEEYRYSPVKVVDETRQPHHWHLAAGEGAELPLLARLTAEGFGDYVILPLAFQDTTRSAAASFAVKAPARFSDMAMGELRALIAIISPVLEVRVLGRVARDLLSTYLGVGAGERVLKGQIRRGDATSIFSAVWFCDLRGFTAFTQENITPAVIERLNVWFDLAVRAVEENQGEVLKFMGDGLLAIFPAEELNPQVACGHALAAATMLEAGVDALNAAGTTAPIDFGLSLHLGYVAFGNIGGARRLDFTVIGPAVNLASRLMDVAKHCDRRIVVSQAFAGCSGRPTVPLGTFELRGLPHPEPVHAPA